MAFGGSGGVTLPVYRPQDVTAQAPHSLVSGEDVARSGEDIAAGLSQLGQGTGQLASSVATDAGQQAAASTIVTRNPDGTPVVSPHPALIFGQAGDNYARAAQDGTAAKLQGTVAQDYADMATKYQGDPEGFQQHAQAYNQQLVGVQQSPRIADALSRYTSGLMAQHYSGLVQQKASIDLADAHSSINTQITTAKSQMLSLARQGGTGTATFQAAQQQYEAGLKALGSNPLFRTPADTIQADRENTYDLANSEAVLGHIDRTFATQGRAAAQKQLEDGIVNNPNSTLTESQRSVLYHQGMARIAYLSSQNKAGIVAGRESVKGTIALLAKGDHIPDAALDMIHNQAQSLGDTESVDQLNAARTIYKGVTVPLTGMTPEQRASTLLGSVSPAQMSGALLGQESGNNPNSPTSVDGAQGIGQIEPATFAQYAKPGENIANPADNLAVHQRLVADYMQRYNGDPARVAVAYFSGPGNVAPAGSPTPYVNDTHDGNGKSVSSYVADVTGRLQGAGVGAPSANGVPFTAAQLAANPLLASTYIQKLASDAKMQVSTGKALLTSIAQGAKAGFMPNPQNLANAFQLAKMNPKELGDQAAQLRATLAGSTFGASAAGGGPAGGALLSQADQMANGGSIQQQQFAMAAHASVKQSAEELKTHPFDEALRSGWIAQPPPPLNFADPNALATAIHQRGVAATVIGSHTGTILPAFSPSDEPQVKALLANGPIDQRLGLLSAVANLPQDVRQATLQKLAPTEAAPFAVAGLIDKDSPGAAKGILEGEDLARAEPKLLPTNPDAAFIAAFPVTDFPNAQIRGPVLGAAKALYAKFSSQAGDSSGKLNTDRLKQAIDGVTGGVLSFNSSNIVAPWYGATQGQLNAAIQHLTDADFAGARTADGSTFPAAALQRRNFGSSGNWRLQSIGDGKYLVFSGDDQARRYLGRNILDARDQGPNEPPGSMPGGPFVLDISRFKGIPESAPIVLSPPGLAPMPAGLAPGAARGMTRDQVQPLPVSREIGQ